jgi:Cys-tRNA(Pro)/Cys-tRNA(Cys) deacylase
VIAETPATLAMTASGVAHRVMEYGPVASLREAAAKRGMSVAQVMKSLVVRTGDDAFVMVIVPGDRVIDWPKLRAHLGVSRMSLAEASEALRVTGYPRGAITPFGSKRVLRVIIDSSAEGEISLGGGAHGMSIHLDVADFVAMTAADVVDVTRPID